MKVRVGVCHDSRPCIPSFHRLSLVTTSEWTRNLTVKVLNIPGWETVDFDEKRWASGSFVYLRSSMLGGTYLFLVVSTGFEATDQQMIRLYHLKQNTFHDLHETVTTKDITLSSASGDALLYWLSHRDGSGSRDIMVLRPSAASLAASSFSSSGASTLCTVLSTTSGSANEVVVSDLAPLPFPSQTKRLITINNFTLNKAASLYEDILVYASADGKFYRVDLDVDNDGYFNHADLFPVDGYGARDTDNDGVGFLGRVHSKRQELYLLQAILVPDTRQVRHLRRLWRLYDFSHSECLH